MRFLFIIAGPSLFLGGCTLGPDFGPPPPPITDSYTESELSEKTVETKIPGGEAQYFLIGRDIPACWWYLFHSPPLNKLIIHALRNSPNLQAAQAALYQAEANLDVATASIFPAISLQGSAERERANLSSFDLPAQPRTFNLFNASVNVSYTLDFWGAIRRQIEAAEAQLDSQKFQVEATYLTLTSNIVTTAISEASLRAQIQATEELIASQEKILNITRQKFHLGGTSRLEVLAQEAQLAQTRASLAPLENSLAQTRHALSVLIGELPSESNLPCFCLADLQLPIELPVSFPSCLVQQRPDVRAAEALLHVASAQIGVATANLFPQITLTGSYGGLSNKLADLFDKNANVWSIAGNILQPVFQGGALIAKREAAIAAYEQAFAQYRQTVLQAFQNVADTLRALEIDAQQLQIQTQAENAAAQTLSLVENQYKLGAVSYINLLDAERQYQQARIARIKAVATRYADTAALFQAFGGGWWNRKPLCPVSVK